MPRLVNRFLFLSLSLALMANAYAHQVPSMTIEAEFGADQDFTLRMNLDPRVVLSDDPTLLPPVPASWYQDLTPTEREETLQKVQEYLRANVILQFGEQKVALPKSEVVPMDGATNAPPTPDTAELHLLATAKGSRPASGGPFTLHFGNEARVSLILLNTLGGQAERRPQVLFPGESSRSFMLPAPPAPVVSITKAPIAAATAQAREGSKWPMTPTVLVVGAVVIAICAMLFWRAKAPRT